MNSKVAILGDIHWGKGNNSAYLRSQMDSFFHEQFFPYLIENGIDTVIQMGDTIDNRKFLNVATIQAINFYHKWFDDHQINYYTILGNHDIYNNNTIAVNSMQELLRDRYEYVKLIEHATNLKIHGKPILLVPWINVENKIHSLGMLKTTAARTVFGHFEIMGFEMVPGVECENGLATGLFKDFDLVLSGHFHKKSFKKNILYVGTPYQLDWSDYGIEKGFWVMDFATNDLDYVQNKKDFFVKILYDDSSVDYSTFKVDQYTNKIVKVMVQTCKNETTLNLFLARLGKVVHDFMVEDLDESEDSLESDSIEVNIENPLKIMFDTVEASNTIIFKSRVKTKINDIFNEAQECD